MYSCIHVSSYPRIHTSSLDILILQLDFNCLHHHIIIITHAHTPKTSPISYSFPDAQSPQYLMHNTHGPQAHRQNTCTPTRPTPRSLLCGEKAQGQGVKGRGEKKKKRGTPHGSKRLTDGQARPRHKRPCAQTSRDARRLTQALKPGSQSRRPRDARGIPFRAKCRCTF